jgi:hypothetical protein
MDASAHFPEAKASTSRVKRLAPELFIGAIALVARALVVVWARGRFPPAADGFYYHTIGSRVAAGLGSTWEWPDGAVTYAAHYPIGYPALLALAYRIGGVAPSAAGVLNALIGTAGAIAAYRLAREATGPRLSFAAGVAVALHPALVMYTPALMTEGVTAALVTVGAAFAARRSVRATWGVGIALGVATLVRPQSLLLAPVLGFLCCPARSLWTARMRRAVVAVLLAIAVCLPWTIRNCVRMHQCALVSFNGGWNLLIGAGPNATGTWAPVDVPEPCRTVWDEAKKDDCFGREARRMIAAAPGRWLHLIPARLAATFDYGGAPGYYLHASNSEAFDDRAKVALGAIETAYERLAWIGALVAVALAPGSRRRLRMALSLLSIGLLFQLHAYLAAAGLLLALALLGPSLVEGAVIYPATLAVLFATFLVHAVFFGAGRYAMVSYPLVTALAFILPPRRPRKPAAGPSTPAANSSDDPRAVF